MSTNQASSAEHNGAESCDPPPPERTRIRAVALIAILLVTTTLNLGLFGIQAESLGERYGFSTGQEEDLGTRMSIVSGNSTIKDTWHLHYEVGAVVGEGQLHLPPRHPLSEDLLTFFADVDWFIGEEVTVSDTEGELALSYEHTLQSDAQGELYYLVTEITDSTYVLARVVPQGELRAEWILLPARLLPMRG